MGISIKITHINDEHFEIESNGEITNKITEQDKKDFGISCEGLSAAEHYASPYNRTSYRNVKDSLLKQNSQLSSCVFNPSSANNLPSTINQLDLSGVVKTTRVKTAELIEVSTDPVTIKTQQFINKHSPVKTSFNTSFEEKVDNTASSTWNNENYVQVGQSISYGIKAVKGGTSFSYSRTWGNSETKSQSVSIQSATSIALTLEPRQSVIVELTAIRKIAKIQITYESKLDGRVAIGHQSALADPAIPIQDIMKSSAINNSLIATETVELQLYSDSSLTVKNLS